MPPPVDDRPNGRATRAKGHIPAVADMVSAPSLDHRGMETRMDAFAKGPARTRYPIALSGIFGQLVPDIRISP